MSLTNRYIVLFFSAGIVPSPAELEAARDLGPNVRWRNVAHHVEGSVEPCTAVAGLVPDDYLVHYPRAVSYVDWIGGKLPVVVPPPPPAEPDGAIDAAAFLGPAPGSAKPRTRGNSGSPPVARAPSAIPPVSLPSPPPAGDAGAAPPPPPAGGKPADWQPNG